jgi:hypothetical protein
MKVFVAIGGHDYEGYSAPIGVYSTKELAEEAFKKMRGSWDDRDIFEYEIDAEPTT